MKVEDKANYICRSMDKGGEEEEEEDDGSESVAHLKVTKILERNLIDCLRSEYKIQLQQSTSHNPYNDSSKPISQYHLQRVCHAAWMQFANKHQKSPTHKNNNNARDCQSSKPKPKRKRALIQAIDNDNDTSSSNKYKSSNEIHNNEIAQTKTKPLNNRNDWIDLVHSTLSFFIVVFQFIFCSALVSFFMYCMVVLHKPTQSIISRNTQDLIYPFMRYLRILALPYVEQFPVITNLYEDSCLISNPYFTMTDDNCWPCETARNIVDLTGLEFSNFSQVYHGIPFIVTETLQSELDIDDIRTICSQYIDLMTKVYVHPNLNTILTLQQLIQPESSRLKDQKLHVQWKISRVATARLLRKYFPKPYFIPNRTEVSVQHFLFIDQSRSNSYSLPVTEFANVFVMQASGSRYIVLIPTERCREKCRVVSAILKPREVLFYNWLYWRPMSVPVLSSTAASTNLSINLSVSYVGSFY